MEYKIINPLEWELLRPIFESQNDVLPDASTATAAIADDDGIVGMWVLRNVLHAGPLWVREDHRGREVWRGLHGKLEEIVPHIAGTGYYTFSGTPKVEAIHRKLGFHEIPWKVWERRF